MADKVSYISVIYSQASEACLKYIIKGKIVMVSVVTKKNWAQ